MDRNFGRADPQPSNGLMLSEMDFRDFWDLIVEFLHQRMKTVVVQVKSVAQLKENCGKARMHVVLRIPAVPFGQRHNILKIVTGMHTGTGANRIEKTTGDSGCRKARSQFTIIPNPFIQHLPGLLPMAAPAKLRNQINNCVIHFQFDLKDFLLISIIARVVL